MTDSAVVTGDRRIVQLNGLAVVAGYEELLRAAGLDTLEAWFRVSDDQSLRKPGLSPWRERLRMTLELAGRRETFYLKRFVNPPAHARRQTRRSGSGAFSLAGVEWAWMHRLTTDGVPCAPPVAFGEVCRRGRELRSAVLSAAVPGDSLERWVGRWGGEARAVCRGLLEPLAVLVGRLHDRGYVHRDLYLSHVFYNPDEPAETALRLIDLQRVLRPLRRCRRWIVKDLASLDFSTPRRVVGRTDRLRWLKHYIGVRRLDTPARQLAYRIVGKSRQIARHDRRRRLRLGLEVGGL
jgi:hypothetical protein